MMVTPNTNLPSLSAQRFTNSAQEAQNKNLTALSSGKRINSAADDAAGSAIVERFAAQILGNSQGIRNLNDAVSLSQTAEGALSSISDNTARIRELTVAAGNSTLSASDRQAMQAEVNQLSQSNQDIIKNTEFNGQAILQGGNFNFQGGANADQQLSLNTSNLASNNALGTTSGQIDLSSSASASASLSLLDQNLQTISGERSNLGAFQNRIESSINNLQTSVENQSAAKSRIADTDYASQTAALAQNAIRAEAGLAMQALANASSKQVLSLLGS
ncbi:flagellin FliC [Chitinibacter bivalviorum]|uniref:Flagellin n=1 Tax=Chitinibacter bivalviorum TaxID=2739434 RepID=A0A7H9BEY4_9NEIS|nr:flagellin [Chitinibacter bivalviorum]QLG87270.1 flagellin FliC [Chitinibacter bivalviorum]